MDRHAAGCDSLSCAPRAESGSSRTGPWSLRFDPATAISDSTRSRSEWSKSRNRAIARALDREWRAMSAGLRVAQRIYPPRAHAGQLRAAAERGHRGAALLPQQPDRGHGHGDVVHRLRGAGRLFAGALSGAGAPFDDGVHPDEPDVPDGAAADTDLHLLRAHAAARYPRGGDSGARRYRPAVQRLAAAGLHRHRAARSRGGGGD